MGGQAKPLLRPSPILCPEIHGESGLDGPMGGPLLRKSPRVPLPGKAIMVMYERISCCFQATRQAVRLVCTGALTNAALLLLVYPEVASMIEVVLMGGCMGLGNTGPVVEFNIQTDPEAAKVVFESGVPLTMIPLEVTHTALVTQEVLTQLINCQPVVTPFLLLIQQLLTFFADTYREVFRFPDPPLHDPCAVAYVVDPDIFEVERMRVDIEVSSHLSAGQTVCDIWHQTGRLPNCVVATKMDVARFWDLMMDAVRSADGVSSLNIGFHKQLRVLGGQGCGGDNEEDLSAQLRQTLL